MSIKAQFDSKCLVCGIEIKKGTTIQKVNDHWCSDENCVMKKIPKEKPKDQSTLDKKGGGKEANPQAKEFKTSKIPKDENIIEPGSPHEEAELIDRWAKDRAWKITMQDYSDYNNLSSDKQRSLGIESNMREKILVNAVIQLYQIWGIKRGT